MAQHDTPNPSGNSPRRDMVEANSNAGSRLPNQLGFPIGSNGSAVSAYRQPEILTKGMDQTGLVNALRRRWLVATGLGLLAAALTGLALFYLVPESSLAKAVIHLSSKDTVIFQTVEGSGASSATYDLFTQTQLGQIQQDDVLRQALTNPAYGIQDLKVIQDCGSNPMNQIKWLRENVTAQMKRGSEYMEVSLKGDYPTEDMKSVVAAVVKSYIDNADSKARGPAKYAYDELQKKYVEKKEQLNGMREKYYALASTLGTSADSTAGVMTQMKMSAYQNNRREVQRLQDQFAQAALDFEIKKGQKNNAVLRDQEIEAQIAMDPSIQGMQQQIAMLDGQIQQYKASSNVKTPALLRLYRQKNELAKSLNQAVAQAKSSANAQAENAPNLEYIDAKKIYDLTVRQISGRVQRLNAEALELEAELKKLASNNTELLSKHSELMDAERLVSDMSARLATWGVENSAPSRIQLAQTTSVTPQINTTMRYFIIGSGSLIALGLTCFGVGLLEFRKRRLDAPEQMDEGLGIRVVGTLPSLSRRSLNNKRSPVVATLSESIDSVRTMLMHDSTSKDRRVVMVTSPETQEGRTTVASQLAASLARAGRRTLLIDGDMRNPALHKLFDLPLEDGLCEILRAEADPSDAIQATYNEGLWVLTAGYCDADAMHALANDQLQPIFEKFREEYDFVIIDGAPVLGLPDTLILGQYADGAIVSVLRDHSRVKKVYQTAEALKGVGIRVIGAVVNGVKTKADARIRRPHLAKPKNSPQPKPEPVVAATAAAAAPAASTSSKKSAASKDIDFGEDDFSTDDFGDDDFGSMDIDIDLD